MHVTDFDRRKVDGFTNFDTEYFIAGRKNYGKSPSFLWPTIDESSSTRLSHPPNSFDHESLATGTYQVLPIVDESNIFSTQLKNREVMTIGKFELEDQKKNANAEQEELLKCMAVEIDRLRAVVDDIRRV